MLTKINIGDHCTAHRMCSYTSMILFFFKWVHHVIVRLRLIKKDHQQMHASMLHFQQRTRDDLGRIRGQFWTAGLTWENKVNSKQNLGAMRMGVRIYRWFNLPHQFWIVFNIYGKIEIFLKQSCFKFWMYMLHFRARKTKNFMYVSLWFFSC
jgi:hypothetical protein